MRSDCADCSTETGLSADASPRRPARRDSDPFYVHGDLDGDGIEGCVVVVVRRSDPARRLVLVFAGGATSSLAWSIPPVGRIDIWPDPRGGRAQQSRVMIGPVDTEPGEFIAWRRDRFIVRSTGW